MHKALRGPMALQNQAVILLINRRSVQLDRNAVYGCGSKLTEVSFKFISKLDRRLRRTDKYRESFTIIIGQATEQGRSKSTVLAMIIR
jgi:hypothetical protein